jgi:hypothetical protein
VSYLYRYYGALMAHKMHPDQELDAIRRIETNCLGHLDYLHKNHILGADQWVSATSMDFLAPPFPHRVMLDVVGPDAG